MALLELVIFTAFSLYQEIAHYDFVRVVGRLFVKWVLCYVWYFISSTKTTRRQHYIFIMLFIWVCNVALNYGTAIAAVELGEFKSILYIF